MLAIAVESKDNYYRLGLINIIEQISKDRDLSDYKILHESEKNINEEANIIFTDNVAIINFYKNENTSLLSDNKNYSASALHITFNASHLFIEDIYNFIVRIFSVAKLPPKLVVQDEFYRHLKIRKSAQLSEAEKRLVILSGYGYDIANISKIMRCSPNSSYTYRRNAMKKLGMENRLQFYKYVQILKNFKQYNNIFICF